MTAKYVLRDLPGVADLEARLRRIEEHPNPNWAPELDGLSEEIDRVAKRLFGLTTEQVGAEVPLDENPQLIGILEEKGWDLNGRDGQPMLCLAAFAAPLFAVAAGVGGHFPDQANQEPLSEKEASALEARLAADRAKFRPKR